MHWSQILRGRFIHRIPPFGGTPEGHLSESRSHLPSGTSPPAAANDTRGLVGRTSLQRWGVGPATCTPLALLCTRSRPAGGTYMPSRHRLVDCSMNPPAVRITKAV